MTRTELHRYMSEPRWSTAQEQTADEILAGVESDLEGALYGAVITPQLRIETARITPEGLVQTSLPVHRVLALDGVVLAASDLADPQTDLPLPTDYTLVNHRLRHAVSAVDRSLAAGWPFIAPALSASAGVVPIRYMGGWGKVPALADAIKRKAAARMGNRHADTMGVTGVTAASPKTVAAVEEFTDADLRSLGRFRNLGWDDQR